MSRNISSFTPNIFLRVREKAGNLVMIMLIRSFPKKLFELMSFETVVFGIQSFGQGQDSTIPFFLKRLK